MVEIINNRIEMRTGGCAKNTTKTERKWEQIKS